MNTKNTVFSTLFNIDKHYEVSCTQQLLLAKFIEDQMKIHKLNQTQLAKKLGCHRNYVLKLLRGDANLNIEMISKIGIVFGYHFSLTFTKITEN